MPTISGKNVKVTVTKEGQPFAIINAKSAELNDDGEIVKKKFLGEKRPRVSRSENGHSGSITFEVEDGDLEDLLSAQIALADNNKDTNIFGLQVQEEYPDGSVKAYAYRSACLKLSRSVNGDDFTKKLDFTAEDFEIIA